MNLILVLIAAVVGWLLPKNDHVLSMIAAVASFAALYLSAHAAGRAVRRHDEEEERLALVRARARAGKVPPENRKSCRADLALQDFFRVHRKPRRLSRQTAYTRI